MTFPDLFLTEIRYRYKQIDEIITNGELYWHFNRAEANLWIERYQSGFADKTTDGSDNR